MIFWCAICCSGTNPAVPLTVVYSNCNGKWRYIPRMSSSDHFKVPFFSTVHNIIISVFARKSAGKLRPFSIWFLPTKTKLMHRIMLMYELKKWGYVWKKKTKTKFVEKCYLVLEIKDFKNRNISDFNLFSSDRVEPQIVCLPLKCALFWVPYLRNVDQLRFIQRPPRVRKKIWKMVFYF